MAALLRRRGARLVQRLGGFLRQGKVDSSRVVRVSDDWPEFFDAKIRDAWLARKGFVFCVQKFASWFVSHCPNRNRGKLTTSR
jgi:hypothetical protein